MEFVEGYYTNCARYNDPNCCVSLIIGFGVRSINSASEGLKDSPVRIADIFVSVPEREREAYKRKMRVTEIPPNGILFQATDNNIISATHTEYTIKRLRQAGYALPEQDILREVKTFLYPQRQLEMIEGGKGSGGRTGR